MMNSLRKAMILPLVLSLILPPILLSAADAPQEKEPDPQSEQIATAQDFGYGMGSVLTSLFYSPFKITYAGLGLITGGVGYVLSGGNTDVATNIIYPAVRGNYVVTPQHLKGEELLIFVGPPPTPEPAQPQQAASAAPAQR